MYLKLMRSMLCGEGRGYRTKGCVHCSTRDFNTHEGSKRKHAHINQRTFPFFNLTHSLPTSSHLPFYLIVKSDTYNIIEVSWLNRIYFLQKLNSQQYVIRYRRSHKLFQLSAHLPHYSTINLLIPRQRTWGEWMASPQT